MKLNYRESTIILYNLGVVKYIQTKDLLIKTMDLKAVLTGLVSM